ncbi:MAG: hypothetical protein V3V07_01150 [candidate division NC10 bacterium]|jgi:hypothetical protein
MRSLMIFFPLVFLVMPSSIALGFHDSMPKEIYAELQEYGVTFIEYDGLVLRKDGCPNVRRTLLKNGPISKSRGMALFLSREDGHAERLIGAEVRDDEGNLSFVWRSSDFWEVAACHFPDKYKGKQAS